MDSVVSCAAGLDGDDKRDQLGNVGNIHCYNQGLSISRKISDSAG